MTGTLDGLLRAIHPSVTIERYERRVNAAVARTRPYRRLPRRPRELMLTLAAFEHRMSMPERDRTPFAMASFELYARRVDERLRRHYGERGIGVAFQIVNGRGASGLREVVTFLARQYVQDQTALVVGSRVDHFLAGLDQAAQVNAARLYLRRFGRLLAPDQRVRDPAKFARVLPRVLRQHPYMLRELSKAPPSLRR